jgi:hypothetical protein
MKNILLGIAVAHLGVATLPAATLFNFNGSSLTSTTGDPLPTTVAIDYAYLVDKDSNGDSLAVPFFDVDASAGPVTASSPLLAGYGPDIDGDALDGILSPIMFTFAHPLDITGFRAMLDDSTLGNLPGLGTSIEFYTSFGALIGSIGINQDIASFEAIGAGPFNGVSKMVLPSGAFYDNVEFTGVSSIPEPGSLVAVGCFLSTGLFLRSRRNLKKA